MQNEFIELIARDRIEIPLSSMYQKMKKSKQALARDLANRVKDLDGSEFESERIFAYVDRENKEKARGMKEAIAEFSAEHPEHGAILQRKVEEKRKIAEEHLYFGVNTGCRLTTDDYISVMRDLGLSETVARNLYPDLINVSRKLAKAREEDRRVIVGKYAADGQAVSEEGELAN
ncbi:MAG: hypothetical protein FJY98_01575 [Candidatus Liptonbacteria bacterium]|nr:hypothetical protein [Candidatus Pacearchaeota archaeon]MBM3256998.1 hypothetical protein [Candidatus Liptonbacteria bacterium]